MAKAASVAAPKPLPARSGLAPVWRHPLAVRLRGAAMAAFGLMLALALASYDAADPSFNAASALPPANLLGRFGANLADLSMQSLGLAAWLIAFAAVAGGAARASGRPIRRRIGPWLGLAVLLALAGALALPSPPAT